MKSLISFFIVMSSLFFSMHANAEVTLHTPRMKIQRLEGTNFGDVTFYNGSGYLGGWKISLGDGYIKDFYINVDNVRTIIGTVPEQKCWFYRTSTTVGLWTQGAGCQEVFDTYIVGKTYNVYLGPSNKICLQAGMTVGGDDFGFYDREASGVECGYSPPPECVGDECVCTGDECLTPPEPSLSCSVKTSSINLAYGNMMMGSASGKTASGKVNVNCNKAGAKLTMSLKSGGSSIGLSNGMTTALTAGGTNLGTTISASKGDNNITVQGTLKGTEKEGVFSGSGVLVTDYQ